VGACANSQAILTWVLFSNLIVLQFVLLFDTPGYWVASGIDCGSVNCTPFYADEIFV